MGILYLEGFDYTDQTSEGMSTYNDAARTITKNDDSYELVGTAYRRGSTGAGYRMRHYAYCKAERRLASDVSTIYTGFALWLEATTQTNSSYAFISIWDKDGIDLHARIDFNTSNQIYVRNAAGTTVATSTAAIPVTTWGYIEVKVNAAASGSCVVKWNGETIINVSSDFQDGSTTAGRVIITPPYNIESYTDDWYIADDQFYGDCKVITIHPDSDGNYTDFTPLSGNNYENVDEVKADGDTTYNLGSAVGDKDTFGVTVGALGGPVLGLQVTNRARKDSGAVAAIKSLVRSNSTDYNGTSEKYLSEEYEYIMDLWTTDPDDSNPWTQTKIEAAEFGVEVTVLTTTTTT